MLNYDFLEECMLKVGIGPEWWKKGGGPRGAAIFLDCRIDTVMNKFKKFLDIPGITVVVTTAIPEENYIEIGIYEE